MGKKISRVELGQRIHVRRKELDKTLEDVANAVNVTPQFIQMIEKGNRLASADVLLAIASFLNFDLDYFFYGQTKPIVEKKRKNKLIS